MPGIFFVIMDILYLLLLSYQIFYIPVSLFGRRKNDGYKLRFHELAVLICARNEETVIGELLDSINRQTYPREHFMTFVMADNCSDTTAPTAVDHGAVVYERNGLPQGKSYALAELLECIERDYGERFDACLVFDADNVLKEDFLEQMNICFCKGNRMIAGCIRAKNYSSNWLSAGYSLYLLWKNRFLNQAREILGLSCAINGTGFMFERKIIGKWPYHTLTEDIEFSVDQACRGSRIAYCPEAIVYDEQPTSLVQSFYQRLRWSKGYLQVMKRYSLRLLAKAAGGSFCCFDMFSTLVCAYMLAMIGLIGMIAGLSAAYLGHGDMTVLLSSILTRSSKSYLCMYLLGLLPTVTEWKKIRASSFRKILYTFTFPLFMSTYVPIAFCAMFAKVTWRPIRHTASAAGEGLI